MNFYSYMNGMNAIAQDESLAEHDKKYHPNGYKDGDRCSLRDKLRKEDDVKDGNTKKTAEELLDEEYFNAIKSGDKAKIQALVNKTALKKMGNVMQDEDGNPLIVYRGSPKWNHILDNGLIFATDEEHASQYGEVKPLFLRANEEDVLYVEGGRATYAEIEIPEELRDSMDVDGDTANADEIAKAADDSDYTAVVISNVYDSPEGHGETPQTDYIVFRSNQVKSAEPITYDDDGKVIPLSQRFQKDNKDIRY